MLAAAGDLGRGSARSSPASRPDGGDGRRHGAGRAASSSRATDGLVVRAEDVVEREYPIPHNAKLLVENGQEIRAGDAITDGPINPQEYLDTRGKDAVQRYLVKEVQKVYRSQGVTINDKHIEIIVRQMLRKVRIDQPGDVDLLPTELVDRFEFEELNNRVLAEGGEPATAQTVLLGVTKASLNTSCFLAAASFQETTRVLTEAAINGAKDHLIGLKENVIIGKLIPAGSGRAGERRGPQGARAPGGPRGPRRRGPRRSRRGRVQPVPRGRAMAARRDEEAAGLALAATIAGGDADDGDDDVATRSSGRRRGARTSRGRGRGNPFLAERSGRRKTSPSERRLLDQQT